MFISNWIKQAITPLSEPDGEARRLLKECKNEAKRKARGYQDWKPKDLEAGNAILNSPPEVQIAVLVQLCRSTEYDYYCTGLETNLLQRDLPFTAEQLLGVLENKFGAYSYRFAPRLRPVRRFLDAGETLSGDLRVKLQQIYSSVRKEAGAEAAKIAVLVNTLLGDAEGGVLPDDSGETWATLTIADVNGLDPGEASAWKQLFAHGLTADGSKPSRKWTEKARGFSDTIGARFAPTVARWFSAVSAPPVETVFHKESYRGQTSEWTETISKHTDRNVGILKGLAWASAGRDEPEIARALGKMAAVCFTKIPGQGSWAVRAASAAIYALGDSPGNPEAVPALSRLRTRVAHRPTLAVIERTLETVAKRQGVTKDDLEDLSVPTYGLDADGTRRETFPGDAGEYVVVCVVDRNTGEVSLSYFAPDGKTLKTVPTVLKTGENAERFKALKADADAAGKTLTAQKMRFDGFYLARRTWKYADFVSRFVTHPLLARLANRLVWHFAEGGAKGEGFYDAATGEFADVDGEPLSWLSSETTVALWHPLGFAPEYVLRWRERLAALGVVQPFKQAYREVYLLTEAELSTGRYSNRFAGHILKQHQMNALAHGRGWRHALQGGWDGGGDEQAERTLAGWNLRAEYFLSGAGNDLSDAGIYTYVSTDQVRFYRLGEREPLALTEVPALAFSEILRDVDLFVGVASVGNDPAWADTGANRSAFGSYWHEYGFGELSASAETRGAVLAKLLPRLKIAAKCKLSGRFLRVRGDLRTYKIHLGSANILMEPNDQYLCIVPGRRTDTETGSILLPFEGDARLSVILSKAFLLADDTKITDSTIISQIKGRR
ncbi:MAG: DUF4132 domain-containing protein [Akkermansiaceae bacterium]|nr:DUF4132 domain-containing protein [Armatimonadota bacterium]